MTDLFDEEAPQDKPQEPEKKEAPASQPPEDPFKDLLGSITDHEGRVKYADTETALKSIPHAENTILSLRQELREAQDKLEKATTVEELAASLGKNNPKAQEEQPSPKAPEVDVVALVEETLQKREEAAKQTQAVETQKTNAYKVRDTLLEKHGDKAKEVFSKKAEEMGTTPESLAVLARTEPDLVLNLFNAATKPTSNPMSGGVDTSTFNKSPAPELTPPQGRTTKDMVAAYRAHAEAIANKS